MPQVTEKKLAFIEEMGLALEGFGLSRMAGRVLGALLVADPPEQSAEELAELLQASRGSISGSTRMLETLGIIERISKPGERRDYFRNKPNAWYETAKKEFAAISQFRQLTEKGIALIDSNDPEVLRGLNDMRDFLIFWEREFPKVFERWESESKERNTELQASVS